MSRIRSRLTYGNVVATLSLFLVLSGGTAVALTGSNTVFSDDIVDNQVKSADVRNDTLPGGGLTGADVKESSLGRVPQAGNAGTLDALDSTHFGVGIMGGVMKDAGLNAVANGTQYAPIGVSTSTASGPFVAPRGGFVARDLEIALASPNGAGEQHTFEFATNPPSSPTLACTVSENASSCSDTTHAVTVSAGELYSMMETAVSGSSRTVDVRFGWRAVSP
jgi:hypothetical protein